MAGFSAKYLTIASEPEYKSVGKKNTPLIRLFLLENHNRKIDGEWQTVNTSAHSAVAWGQTATDMVMELSKGDQIDLSAQIAEGEDGQYVKFRAFQEDNEWTDKEGNEHVDKQITIRSYEKHEKNND